MKQSPLNISIAGEKQRVARTSSKETESKQSEKFSKLF